MQTGASIMKVGIVSFCVVLERGLEGQREFMSVVALLDILQARDTNNTIKSDLTDAFHGHTERIPTMKDPQVQVGADDMVFIGEGKIRNKGRVEGRKQIIP